MKEFFRETTRILFIGDSITDCGRDRDDWNSVGDGFVCQIKTELLSRYAHREIAVLNKGISGDRVDTLVKRLEEDCIRLQPDYVNILIGINNTIHRFKGNLETTLRQFESAYRTLVERVQEGKVARITLMEPFLLPVEKEGFKPAYIPVEDGWDRLREDLNPKIEIIRKIAREYGIPLIPLDGMFAAAAVQRPMEFWLHDGIHPTVYGHALMARTWLDTVQKVYGIMF